MSAHSNNKNLLNRYKKKDVIQPTSIPPAGAHNGDNTDDQDIRVRKYGEVVYNTLSTVASVLEYPKGANQMDFLLIKSLVFFSLPKYTDRKSNF